MDGAEEGLAYMMVLQTTEDGENLFKPCIVTKANMFFTTYISRDSCIIPFIHINI